MHTKPGRTAQSGVGLIEIMVGMVIALLATLVVMEIATNFEAYKRTTGGNADAQTNGNISLYSVTRAVQTAGFGLPLYSQAYAPFGCSGGVNAGGFPIFPVSIVDGPGNTSDTLITYGVKLEPPAANPAESLGGIPLIVSLATTPGGVVTFQNNMSCRAGNIALSIQRNGTNCLSAPVASVSGTTQITLTGIPNGSGTYNQPALGDGVICLPNWTRTMYAIDANNHLTETISAPVGNDIPNPVASDIVNMQIQYGIAANTAAQSVSSWVEPTGIWANGAISPLNQTLIRAIRIAIVARNEQEEKVAPSAAITHNCTNMTSSPLVPTDGVCAWGANAPGAAPGNAPPIIINTLPNFGQYRYRVFETIIPLRNNIINTTTLL